jgi:hypothetical protein
MTMALEGGEGSASRPGHSLSPGKTRYPLYRRLSGPQGRSGQVRKISHPPGFDSRTVQPVASRYTDYATRPTAFHSDTVRFTSKNQQITSRSIVTLYNSHLRISKSLRGVQLHSIIHYEGSVSHFCWCNDTL